MAIKPYRRPKSYKKEDNEVETNKYGFPNDFDNFFKDRWEYNVKGPVPMGNPYSHQPLHYIAKRKMDRRTRTQRLRDIQESHPFMMSTGDMLPHVSRKQMKRFGFKRLAYLHPITSGVMMVDDAITLYDMLK